VIYGVALLPLLVPSPTAGQVAGLGFSGFSVPGQQSGQQLGRRQMARLKPCLCH